ncbi:MAG TPA: AAA family ATPase [Candidatus Saccharimonadales bacterium]|nr:AAA family ATPase [Candidatus Saccharimonadales bacterium]
MNLVIHPDTQQLLESIRANLPQSLLISGKEGIGLLTAATWLAGTHLVATLQPQDAKENTNSQSGTISVEMIRRLYDQTRAKQSKQQVIIIDNADRMSRGAQGAFLKLLEEPNQHTHFILTSHNPQKLLPTIRSRVEHTAMRALTTQQSSEFIASLGVTDSVKQTQLQFIAEGLPAELTRLVHDDAYFKEQATLMTTARDFLRGTPYEKLLIIQQYKMNRDGALTLIEWALHILRRSLSAKPQQTIIAQLELLLEIRDNIASNYNISLQLARFVL